MERTNGIFDHILMGILAAFAFIFVQVISTKTVAATRVVSAAHINVQADQEPVGTPVDVVKVSSYESHLPSPLLVIVTQEGFCLFEVSFEEDHETGNCGPSIPIPLNAFLRTLFTVLISPNAP